MAGNRAPWLSATYLLYHPDRILLYVNTFSTTKSHLSLVALQDDVKKLCDCEVSELFSGEVKKTLLETAQVKVDLYLPFGSKLTSSEKRYEITFMVDGKPQTIIKDYASEVAPTLEQIYARLATEAATSLP